MTNIWSHFGILFDTMWQPDMCLFRIFSKALFCACFVCTAMTSKVKEKSFCEDRKRVWYGKCAFQLNVAKLVSKPRRSAIRTSFYYQSGYHFRPILSPGTRIGDSQIQARFLAPSKGAGTFWGELIYPSAPDSRISFI